MRLYGLIMVGALLGVLVMPGPASAFLICDPCCKKDKKSEQVVAETGGEAETGRRAAILFANAGINYFQGLLHLENSDYAKADNNFTMFHNSASELLDVLDGVDNNISQSLKEVIEYGEAMQILQGEELPSLEIVTGLGKKWAQMQDVANDAVLQRCPDF